MNWQLLNEQTYVLLKLLKDIFHVDFKYRNKEKEGMFCMYIYLFNDMWICILDKYKMHCRSSAGNVNAYSVRCCKKYYIILEIIM